VFKGEVTVVSAILGANYTVIIKHGNYRTVYQNLVNVRVKSGDIVETKEVIGTVGTNAGNETKLHFELWNQMNVIDPELWLSK
ncbi:MAG: murein hydrolase activator EnvC family protein, partial [Bacteroidales bacterium]